jgi:glycine/D-amino acid oxidase-like deaminating enzyme
MSDIERTDVAIIGGGYYGAFIANELKNQNPNLDILVIEEKDALFTKASSTNQGQFHMGYFYSGDPKLAARCAENAKRFYHTFADAIDSDVTSVYGIHEVSKITADQYAAFCENIGIPLRLIERPKDILGPAITSTFESDEKTFNSAKMRKIFEQKLASNDIRVMTGFSVDKVIKISSGLQVTAGDRVIQADHVFNVTFADINSLNERSNLPKIPIRHDTFLHFVIDLPEKYKHTGASVIRGPYASLLPSSFRGGHVLASGKYRRTQSTTIDRPSEDISNKEIKQRYGQAINEAAEYMPLLKSSKFRGHTLGTRTAHLDTSTGAYTSQVTVYRHFGNLPNYHVVLGGKVSNMFDVTEMIKDLVR